MIGIWIFIVLCSGATAQETYLDSLFNNEDGSPANHSSIFGHLDNGCSDCYKCDDPRVINKKISKLQLVDKNGLSTDVCCISQLHLRTRINDNCGKRIPDGESLKEKMQKRTHVRATLVGEYPWRAWIWRKGRKGNPTLFCGGVVVDSNVKAIVTSASCALKYPVKSLKMTFYRSFDGAIDVQDRVVHPEYNKGKPFVNDIALLFRNIRQKNAPKWIEPACTSTVPPLPTTYCKVMSKEDYFIDTVVLSQKECYVNNEVAHVSQMCTSIKKGDFEPEIGAGLFCQDRLRTQNSEYYACGITLQINEEMIAYTNISHFDPWITVEIDQRANP